jgi:hypothetical protein
MALLIYHHHTIVSTPIYDDETENGNALLRLAGRKAKGSLASCIPSRIALNHSHAMRTQKTPDWKRQKTGLREGPANGYELVDAARSGSTQI